MVAPSFQKFEILSEKPFTKGDKRYVRVRNPKTGNERDVRWYTEFEYAKSYGKKEDGIDNLKAMRGFKNGPILVIRGIKTVEDEHWCEKSIARYAVGIGWHIVSTDAVPDDIPEHFNLIILGWDEFRLADDRHMKSPTELAAIINEKVRKKEFVHFKE